MAEIYPLPLVGQGRVPPNSTLMSADDEYMRQPDESDPKLFQLLPDSSHVPPAYSLAGVQVHPRVGNGFTGHYKTNTPTPSHAVTALYTPDGKCRNQQRLLACRLNLLNTDHEFSGDIARYHELKLAEECSEDERAAYTEWVDVSLNNETVNGFNRTTFSAQEPILSDSKVTQQQVSHPVRVTAFVLKSTPWGVIETGACFWPNPDPGDARETVTELATTLTSRTDQLPQPTISEDWPLFYGHDMNPDRLAEEVKDIIAEFTNYPNDGKIAQAVGREKLSNRVQAEYGITERELSQLLEFLYDRGEIVDPMYGAIQLQ